MFVRFIAVSAVVLTAAPGMAQSPAPPFPNSAPITDPSPGPTATTILTEVPESPGARRRFSTDVLIGLPIAGRIQGQLAGPILAEAGLGAWLIIPDLFAGVRLDLGLYHGSENTVSVRPGLVGHTLINPFFGGGGFLSRGRPVIPAASADVDLLWQYRWNDTVCGQAGLKLGVMTTFRSNGRVGAIPIVAMIYGFQF